MHHNHSTMSQPSLLSRAVSWRTKRRQLVISWLGIVVSCDGAKYPTNFREFSHVGFLPCRKACLVRGTYSPASLDSTTTLRAHRKVFRNSWLINPSPWTVPVPKCRAGGASSAEPVACQQTKAVLERPSSKWPFRALLRDRVRATRKRPRTEGALAQP